MKLYTLKKQFNGYKKGTKFYLVAQSEYIGVKEYVFRTKDLTTRISVNENEFNNHFLFVKEVFSMD